jgi:hypothetical protein
MPQLLLKAPETAIHDEPDTLDPACEALEDILEERDCGPFVTITDMDGYRREVREIVTSKLQQAMHHA